MCVVAYLWGQDYHCVTRRKEDTSQQLMSVRISKLHVLVLLAGAGLFTGTIFAADPTAAGVPNFHAVNDQVYRGGQPTGEGFANLSKLGIKTVIDLRNTGSAAKEEEKAVAAAGMRYVAVPLNGMTAPSTANVAKILSVIHQDTAGPVFVHCRRGADRTGTVVACYRIEHDRWDNQKALDEARALGMHWWERAMAHYVLGYKASTVSTAVQPAAVAQ